MVTASADHTARVWDTDTGKLIGKPLWVSKSNAFSQDGHREVFVTPASACVFDVDTLQQVVCVFAASAVFHDSYPGLVVMPNDEFHSAALSPDGRRIVTETSDSTAQLWDADTGKPIGPPVEHVSISSIAFNPDRSRIVAASADHTARVWDADTGKPIGPPLQHRGVVYSAVFSPDGHRVVTASGDHTARVWDAATGKPIGPPLQHHGDVYSAAFSPAGRRVVTASADHTARVWDADTGKPIGPPLQHRDDVYSAVFSPDGRRVVTASADHTARVWIILVGLNSRQEASQFSDLAEVVGGYRIDDSGALVATPVRDRIERLQVFRRSTFFSSLNIFQN